jgi:hypothetical protein
MQGAGKCWHLGRDVGHLAAAAAAAARLYHQDHHCSVIFFIAQREKGDFNTEYLIAIIIKIK